MTGGTCANKKLQHTNYKLLVILAWLFWTGATKHLNFVQVSPPPAPQNNRLPGIFETGKKTA